MIKMRHAKNLIVWAVIAAALAALAGCSSPAPEIETVEVAYSPGSYFVTNIKDSAKLLKSEIVLTFEIDRIKDAASEGGHGEGGGASDEIKAEMDKINYKIRECIIEVLRDKAEDELRAQDAMQIIRDELTAALIETLELKSLKSVSFSEFAIQ